MPGDRERILRELRRRRIAVVGLGVSNQALLRFLLARGARSVAAGDAKRPEELGPAADWLRTLPVRTSLGPGYLEVLEDAEWVFLTPGIRKDLPEIAQARRRGAWVTSETGLLLELCRARTVGITASAGKTTTTTLVGDMLARSGLRVYVGGNIGTPLVEKALDFEPDETVVLELSSFQLQLVDRSPNVGAVLNVSPNHLDVHRDYAEYVQAKKGVYRYQGPGDWAVFGQDNAETSAMARERAASGTGGLALFGRREPPAFLEGAPVEAAGWVEGESLLVRLPGRREPARLCRTGEVRLRGEHNLQNILAATLAACLAGGRLDACGQVATTFETIEHRLEPVAEVDGVSFINDSIGTAPDRTEVALASFPAPIHIILGGYDKKIPFDSLGDSVVGSGKVRRVVLMGQTAAKIRRAIEEAGSRAGAPDRVPQMVEADGMEEAVRLAYEGAPPGTIVLLSPACASFDMYRNYEERGRAFKETVRRLVRRAADPGDLP